MNKKAPQFNVELTELLEAGTHFGHQSKRWNPQMASYLWQTRGGVHIFDLIKTRRLLAQACEAAYKMSAEGKLIIFVGTKRQAQAVVKEEALRSGMPYIVGRWAGGLLTNWPQIKKSLGKMREYKEGLEKDQFKDYTKKERLLIDRKVQQFERLFGGLIDLKDLPDALFIVDTKREATAVREAGRIKIPVFALVDSNCDPSDVAYPIPGNDDAVRSIKLLVGTFANAVLAGRAAWEKKTNKMAK